MHAPAERNDTLRRYSPRISRIITDFLFEHLKTQNMMILKNEGNKEIRQRDGRASAKWIVNSEKLTADYADDEGPTPNPSQRGREKGGWDYAGCGTPLLGDWGLQSSHRNGCGPTKGSKSPICDGGRAGGGSPHAESPSSVRFHSLNSNHSQT